MADRTRWAEWPNSAPMFYGIQTPQTEQEAQVQSQNSWPEPWVVESLPWVGFGVRHFGKGEGGRDRELERKRDRDKERERMGKESKQKVELGVL